jgi:hypothetical protein
VGLSENIWFFSKPNDTIVSMFFSKKFNILDPTTWDKATDNHILWNGAMLYDHEKKPITERSLAELFYTMWALLEKKSPLTIEQKIKSVKTMLDKMVASGQTDPNWIDNEQIDTVEEEEPPKHLTGNVYGDYDFSEAQMEVVSGFTEDKLIKIGEIMVTGRKNHKRSYQIEQDYFNGMGWDGHFFVILDSNKGFPELEEKTMWDYFLGFEDFETEEEIREFFEANEYLKKYPKMREELFKLKKEYLE